MSGPAASRTISGAGLTTSTTSPGPISFTASSANPTTGRPHNGWTTFGTSDFILLPLPAASTTTATFELSFT